MRTTIGLLGDLDLDKPTHRELQAAVALLPSEVEAHWLASDQPEARELAGLDGLWVIPGSPYRDDDAVDAAIAWALESGTPFLGTCGGLSVRGARLGAPLGGHRERSPRRGRS
jgi:CTP synthase (UTP-ammonia lyase)